MEPQISSDKNRIGFGIAIGIIMLFLAAGVTSLAILMVSVFIFGCTKSPPEWIYTFIFIGFPIPLVIASIVEPYLYIKRQRMFWQVLTPVFALFLSCLIFLIWFLILTRYC
ncbi:MAG: hypothetical protein ABIY50_01345 [Ignavibacteria bacterium]